MDFVSFSFSGSVLTPFAQPTKGKTFSERLVRFQHGSAYTRTLALCGKTRMLMDGLLNHSYSGALQAVFVNAQAQLLLLQTLEKVEDAELNAINCKFLSNEADRNKVMRAKEILVEQISEPITIKQLSRRVAMNECYLKRGFKEMFGSTIFDFYQSQRMEHARLLLYEKGLSVTEVSILLGYSSISHFSTAFKKQTGLKPCELLLRT